MNTFGFVQADPIRAPARAQDLTLRHRVTDYRTGDLDRCYTQLDVEEDVFINYGYVPRSVQALMHPRTVTALSAAPRSKRERELLAFIGERVEDVDWYWPAEEHVPRDAPDQRVRVLTPFDPVVWDRRRFELLWGWAYRFEAYTPVPERKLGYYALPVLWRDDVIGWGNLTVT